MLSSLVHAVRLHQWVKNGFVLAPLVFAQELFDVAMAVRTVVAALLFCLSASAVYLLNDIEDVEADRTHPVKRLRPIASGTVSVTAARVAATSLGVLAISASLFISPWLVACVVGYLGLNLVYSLCLKRVAYVDVLCIAAGFELRVVAGAIAASVAASSYLLIVTALLATFLGFGKRKQEIMQTDAVRQRSTLERYNARTLTILLGITGLATFATYVVYTLDSTTRAMFRTDYLVVTSAFVGFGIWRFLRLVGARPKSASPTEEMLRDLPFLTNLALWIAAILVILYART